MNFTSFSGNQRSIASDAARRADFNEIPIISLKADRETLLSQLTDACTRVGFFYLKDHDIPQEKIDALFTTAEKFFAQPKSIKNKINYKQSSILRGYEPPAEVRTDETRKPDLNEAFNWGYEKSLDSAQTNREAEDPGTRSPSDIIPVYWLTRRDRMEAEPNVWSQCLA